MSSGGDNAPRPSLLPPPTAPLLGSRRSWHILVLFSVVAAAVGFFSGTSGNPKHSIRGAMGAGSNGTPAPPAPGYRELRSERRGPNANLYSTQGASAIERFGERVPGLLSDVPPQSEEQRNDVLASRRQLRAYDGAPPTIPHAVQGQSTFECLACHDKGAVVAGKRAPAMSHERHDSCTQCHVSKGGPPTALPPSPLASNAFVGQAPASSGARAWPGAPPTIPHSTLMRSNCGSCHGVVGALGMRSTHPWRESCQQCHAPSAALDQRQQGEPSFP